MTPSLLSPVSSLSPSLLSPLSSFLSPMWQKLPYICNNFCQYSNLSITFLNCCTIEKSPSFSSTLAECLHFLLNIYPGLKYKNQDQRAEILSSDYWNSFREKGWVLKLCLVPQVEASGLEDDCPQTCTPPISLSVGLLWDMDMCCGKLWGASRRR